MVRVGGWDTQANINAPGRRETERQDCPSVTHVGTMRNIRGKRDSMNTLLFDQEILIHDLYLAAFAMAGNR